MPCDSSYMDSTEREKALTKVVLLLDELDSKGAPSPREFNAGYDSRVYTNQPSKETADAWVRELCTRLQEVEDVTIFSLELQVWWRDHQRADKARLAAELEEQQSTADRQVAIAKLSPYERQLLGI